MTTFSYHEQLLRAVEIHDYLIDTSIAFNEPTKQYFRNLSQYVRDILITNPRLNSYQCKTLAHELLSYWNESINPITENFWTELKSHNIDFERKEPLKFALTKKRFRNVEQGIDAKNNWAELKKMNSIIDRFSKTEIEEIENIIAEEQERRLEILKKCLEKNSIPQLQYLKFGECMAYFINCQLLDKYFAQEEIKELNNIWKNFKSK